MQFDFETRTSVIEACFIRFDCFILEIKQNVMKNFIVVISMILALFNEANYLPVLKNPVPYHHRYVQYTIKKNGAVIFNTIMTRKGEFVIRNSLRTFLITQRYENEKGANADSSFCDLNLKPIAYRTHIATESYREEVEFGKDSLNNRVIYKNHTEEKSYPVNFDYNGVITDDLIAAQEMKAGRSYKLKLVNPGKNFMLYELEIKVERIEKINLGGAELDCWKVNVFDGFSTNNYWFTVKDQIQIRKVVKLASGDVFMREILPD